MAGVPPFAGRSVIQVGLAHLQDEPPDPGADRDDLPPMLGWAVRRALAKDPNRRPPTAGAFAHMLRLAANLEGDQLPGDPGGATSG